MREKNHQDSFEESREQGRTERRKIKKTPKMKMTGKGMKRFAVLRPAKPGPASPEKYIR
jgi:hypothetical protein